MDSFLKEIIKEIRSTYPEISDLIFIVPSKRAGLFLKKELTQEYKNQTFFVPQVTSIEEFISELSGLQQIDSLQALFEFYETYLQTHPNQEKESLETFSTWAQTLLHDFNEIDRYCIDHHSFFSYLSSIQDINHWYLQKEKTEMVQNYIRFWNDLEDYYNNFQQKLLDKKQGYQGLLYRKAADYITTYTKQTNQHHILVGFNALNNAEQTIFNTLLDQDKATAYWDSDSFFLNNKYHEAALFLRNYKNNWNFYKNSPFPWIQNHFSEEKDIQIIGVPKNIGQAKLVGQLLEKIPSENMENTALVLADESLLLPVLNALPNTVNTLNITMGLPIKEVPIASFFEQVFILQKQPNPRGFYYKNILQLLTNQASNWLFGPIVQSVISTINKENIVYLRPEKLHQLFEKHPVSDLLFSNWKDASQAIDNCRKIILLLKKALHPDQHTLELEYVYHFHLIFNQLFSLQTTYQHISTITSLHRLYQEICSSENLDFRGEPFRGLQLMGMLETRCLDFDTVIITSMNEGVLPAGKSSNSFIPYDLKRAYQLPTYREKDAIYTYHFYRLIQRAKKVYLIYNTESDGVGGGEKSRFLRQLEIDKRPKHQITSKIASSTLPKIQKAPVQITKTKAIQNQLQELCTHGLSPSAITSYIRNPIDFYYQYVLGIRETQQVEETIAVNTLGTVIHNTLENFYKPLENCIVEIAHIEQMKTKVDDEIKKQFRQEYNQLDINHGKNLLIFEVAKKYIHNFLKSETALVQSGVTLKIISIESNLKAPVKIPELNKTIYIKGKVDRIDQLDGVTRIIDYKTGRVTKTDVTIMDWEVITADYKYSKALQVLAYAYMQQHKQPISEAFLAGIISFKNLKEDFLPFGTKETIRGKSNTDITNEILLEFKTQLSKLIVEMFNLEIPFIEKEV